MEYITKRNNFRKPHLLFLSYLYFPKKYSNYSEILLFIVFSLLIHIYYFGKIKNKSDFIKYIKEELTNGNYSIVINLISKNFDTIIECCKITLIFDKQIKNLFNKTKINSKKREKYIYQNYFDLFDEMLSNEEFLEYLLQKDINLGIKILRLNFREFPKLFWLKYFKILVSNKKSRLYLEYHFFKIRTGPIKNMIEDINIIYLINFLYPIKDYINNKILNNEEISNEELKIISKIYQDFLKLISRNNTPNIKYYDFKDEIDSYIYLIKNNKLKTNNNLDIYFFNLYLESTLIIRNELSKLNFKKKNIANNIIYNLTGNLIELIQTNKNKNISKLIEIYLFIIYLLTMYFEENNDYLFQTLKESINDYNTKKDLWNKILNFKFQEKNLNYLDKKFNLKEINKIKKILKIIIEI